jgi:hypothetical protein
MPRPEPERGAARHGGVGLHEQIKDVRQNLRGDANFRVLNANNLVGHYVWR